MASAMIVEPAATPMYCFLSNTYVIGEAFQFWFVWKLQRGFPVAASTAMRAPPSSPKMTNPVAVVSVPPQDCAGPGCGSSHLIAPVWMSIAFRIRCGLGSVAVFRDPPRYDLPLSHGPCCVV